jgi:hypothetical protein
MATTISTTTIRTILDALLSKRAHPKTICPSEAARALPIEELDKIGNDWRQAMPVVREILWTMRDEGLVEIMQKGRVLPAGLELEDVHGPIRARLRLDEDGMVSE